MSFFVDPTRESNMQGRYLPRFSLLHRVSTTVHVTLYIDGISLEVEQVARSRKWMLEARVTLNCGSDESTSRILSLTNHLKYLPLPLLIFKLEYVYLIWCSASLIWCHPGWSLCYRKRSGSIAQVVRRCRRRIGVLSGGCF